jgi:hypothetical protein
MEFQLCDEQHKYKNILYNSNIISFLIIYIITIIVIIFFIKLPVKLIKEISVEVIKKVIEEIPVEVIKEDNKDEEKELFTQGERALALQTAYEERATIALKKWSNAYIILWDNRNRNNNSNENIRQRNLKHLNEEVMNKNNDKKHIDLNILWMFRTFLGEVNEQYFVNEEKIAREEAFIAVKKANLFESIDTHTRANYAHLFNS